MTSISVLQEYASKYLDSDNGMNVPDSALAVGSSKLIAAINGQVVIRDKSTDTVNENHSLKDWFSEIISNKSEAFVFDPRAIYDRSQDRFVLIALNNRGDLDQGYYLVSVSQTSDPTDDWYQYRISTETDYTLDFPGLGIGDQAIYLTAKMVSTNNTEDYQQALLIDKSDAYDGGTVTYDFVCNLLEYDSTKAFRTMPAHHLTTSSSAYFVHASYSGGDALTVTKIDDPLGNNELEIHRVDVPSYTAPPSANQPDTSVDLETPGARFSNRAVFENDTLWCAHTIAYDWGDSSDECIVNWYKIDVSDYTLLEENGFGRDNNYFWYPSIHVDVNNTVAITYHRSSESIYATSAVAAMDYGDSSMDDFQHLNGGDSAYTYGNSTPAPWGDYTDISLGPVDGGEYWTMAEYPRDSSNQDEYGMWIGNIST